MITDDGILQNLRRADRGSGRDMADHYYNHLFKNEWIDVQHRITGKGLIELARRERVEA